MPNLTLSFCSGSQHLISCPVLTSHYEEDTRINASTILLSRTINHASMNQHYSHDIINPYLTNGVSHHYHLSESTFIFRGIGGGF